MCPFDEALSSQFERMQLSRLAIGRYLESTDDESYENIEPEQIAMLTDCLYAESEDGGAVPDHTVEEPTPDMSSYRELILRTPAYSWLLATLQRETTLTRAVPDRMEDIRKAILAALPSSQHISRKTPPQEYKATFKLDWDPLSFLETQKYIESPAEALKGAITLTGSMEDAQAIPTAKYLAQTWPTTGKEIMELLADTIRNDSDKSASSNLGLGFTSLHCLLIAWA